MVNRSFLSGNEATALAARHVGVAFATGYPGTPSTEVLESFAALGGKAQWAPNEKVAAEVALGAAFANCRTFVTMKHVGLNVAADVLFTTAYASITGSLVFVVADDPGMASSQNEQDTRRYAEAAGVPLFEPADAQDAYDLFYLANQVSERWHIPVIFRLSTRVSHSKSVVIPAILPLPANEPNFVRDIQSRVMIPAHARPAHRRLRTKLNEILAWNEQEGPHQVFEGQKDLGIIAAGVSYLHAREAAPTASILKLGVTYPLPIQAIRAFAASVKRCMVIEENDPWLVSAIRAAGVNVEGKNDDIFRFGELNVARVRRIIAGDNTPESQGYRGKPPELCPGCPHRSSFAVLKKLNCIVAGDIGCYTLSALPPLQAMDTMIDMGAAIGVGLGLRHVLPPDQAKRVVSVIGDSTFIHSGITGLVDMVYNPPSTGHVVIILDNSTTAMTGLQDHPGTGRRLDQTTASSLVYEDLAKALGINNVHVVNPVRQADLFEEVLQQSLDSNELTLIVAKQPCVLHAARQARKRQSKSAETPASPSASPSTPAATPTPVDECPPTHNASQQPSVTNIRFIGLGGMGVLTAADILADVAFHHGCDVKKAEVHGMSQRGGFVSSDIRYGKNIASPMIPDGECDYIVVLSADQIAASMGQLKAEGCLINAADIDTNALPSKKMLNVAVLGALSRHLPFGEQEWLAALHRRFPAHMHDSNEQAFRLGLGGKANE